jgi:hypothetical protein
MSKDQYQYPVQVDTYRPENFDGRRDERPLAYIPLPTALEHRVDSRAEQRSLAYYDRRNERPQESMVKNMIVLDSQQQVEWMRSHADPDTLRLNIITRIFRPIMQELFGRSEDRSASLAQELVNIESEIGGRIVGEIIGENGTTQRFWYNNDNDWFYGMLTKDGQWAYSRYHVTKPEIYKSHNGKPVNLSDRERESFYAIVKNYVPSINEELYFDDRIAELTNQAKAAAQETAPVQSQIGHTEQDVRLTAGERAAFDQIEAGYGVTAAPAPQQIESQVYTSR